MPLENAVYLNTLDAANPTGGDDKRQGYKHIQMVKRTLKDTFPNMIGGTISSGVNLAQLAGVTSNIQAQLNLKAPNDSPAFTGSPTVPMPLATAADEQAASNAYVASQALTGVLASQSGNASKVYLADGATGKWSFTIDTTVVTAGVKGTLGSTEGTESYSNKTLVDPIIADGVDDTKGVKIAGDNIAIGQDRDIVISTPNIMIFTPRYKMLVSDYLAGQANIDVMLNLGFTNYVLELSEFDTTAVLGIADVYMRFNISGTWLTTGYVGAIPNIVDKGLAFLGVSYTEGLEAAGTLLLTGAANSTRHSVAWFGQTLIVGDLSRKALYNSTIGTLDGVRLFTTGAVNTISGGYRLYGVRQ